MDGWPFGPQDAYLDIFVMAPGIALLHGWPVTPLAGIVGTALALHRGRLGLRPKVLRIRLTAADLLLGAIGGVVFIALTNVSGTRPEGSLLTAVPIGMHVNPVGILGDRDELVPGLLILLNLHSLEASRPRR